MRDFRQRVRLIHELRELGRTEELPDGGHHRLGVDEIVRHGRRHFLVDGHLLLDGPLHPHQTDPELVLEQLAHRPDAAVPEVVDVVDVQRVLAQRQQVPDDLVEVLRLQNPVVERRLEAQLRVQLQPPDPREVVLLRVEEEVLEERSRAVEGRRIPRPQPPVDLDQRLLVRADRVLPERGREHRTDLVLLREEDIDRADLGLLRHRDDAGRDLLVRFENHLAGRRIDDVVHGVRAVELVGVQDDGLDAGLLEPVHGAARQPAALADPNLAGLRHDVRRDPAADQRIAHHPLDRRFLRDDPLHAVERADDVVHAAQPEGAQEDRGPGTCACGRCGRRAGSWRRTRTPPTIRGTG